MATIAELNIRLGLLTKGFDRELRGIERKLQQSASRLTSLGSDLAAGFTLPIFGIGAAAIKSAGDLEALRLAITTTMADAGYSTEQVNAELEALRKAALAPGLDFAQAIKASVRLQSVGFEASRARETIVELANALALTGGTAENLDEVVNQFTQMLGKGKLYQEDLRIILGQMPKLATLMRETFGTTTAEGINALGISADQFIATITTKMQELPRVAGGIKNAIVNLFTGVNLAAARLGEEINKAFNIESAGNAIVNVLNKMVDAFAALPDPIKKVIVILAGLAAAAGPVLFVAGKLISVYAALKVAVLSVGGAFALFAQRAAALKAAQAGLAAFTSGLTVASTTAATAQQGLSLAFASSAQSAQKATKAVAAVNAGVAGLSGPAAIAAQAFNAITAGAGRAAAAFSALNVAQRALVVGGVIAAIAGIVLVVSSLNKELTNAEKAQRAVNDVNLQAKKDIAGQKAEVERLTGIIKNETATLRQKEEALTKLQQISPEYYGGLVLAKGRVEGLTNATDNYVQSLLRAAKAQAAQDKIAELARTNLDLEDEMIRQSSMYDRFIAGPFVRGEKAVTEARNKRLKSEIEANNATIKSLSELIIKTDEAATANSNLKPPPPPDPDAIDRAKKQAALYAKALASIAAVAQKGDVLGADVMSEQAREIESQIEKLIENGFKPYSRQIQHLRAMLKDLRADMAKGFETPNVAQQTLGIGVEASTLPTLDIPDQVVRIDTTDATASIKSLQDAALKGIESTSQYKNQWEQVAEIMAGLGENTISFSEAISQSIELLNERGQGLSATFLAMSAAMGDAFANAEGGLKQMALAAVAAGAKVIKVTIQEGVARAVASALSSVPFPFNIALGAVAGGLASGLFSKAISSIGVPGLAKGGVIDEPTLALIGEYPGAKTNPEIVTPENKMRDVFTEVMHSFSFSKTPVSLSAPTPDNQTGMSEIWERLFRRGQFPDVQPVRVDVNVTGQIGHDAIYLANTKEAERRQRYG